MGFIQQMFDATEKRITRTIVSKKIDTFIKNFSKYGELSNKQSSKFNEKVIDSTGPISEIIDSMSSLWIRGMQGMVNTNINQASIQKEVVTDLITNNIEPLQQLISAINNLNTESNKTAIKSIVKSVVDANKQYFSEYQDIVDDEYERDIKVNSINIAETWGRKYRYSILVPGEGLVEVTPEHYEEHKMNYRHQYGEWFETKGFMYTQQSTKDNFEEVKKTGKKVNR